MTENKRFTGHMNEFLTWFEDNGEKMTHTQILDTLNEQHKEIIHLQNQVYLEKGNGEYYKQLFEEKHEENEKLKEQLRNLRRLVNEAYMGGSE